MRRINYLVTWSEQYAGVTLPAAITPALRAPLVALACSIVFVAVVWGVQHARLRAAERDGVELAQRVEASARDVARVRAVEREIARLRTAGERIARIRRSGAQSASDVAALGNRLPPDVWLTSLRADRGALALEGRSTRLGAVGTTIADLARLPSYTGARLIAVHEDPSRSGVTYALTLDARP